RSAVRRVSRNAIAPVDQQPTTLTGARHRRAEPGTLVSAGSAAPPDDDQGGHRGDAHRNGGAGRRGGFRLEPRGRPLPRGHAVRPLLDRLAELVAGLVYVAPERARAFTHETSSFIWSTDSVGVGGTPRRSSFTPTRSRMPASAPATMVTINAA